MLRTMSGDRPLHLMLTADAVGGVWQHALDLIRGLRGHHIRITLVVLGPPPRPGEIEAASALLGVSSVVVTGLPLDWTADSPETLRDVAGALAALAETHAADLVQVHAPALADARYRMPVVAVCHSCVATWWRTVRGADMPEDFRWRMQAAARGLAKADAAVAPSQSFAELMAAVYGLDRKPLVIRNGRSAPPSLPRVDGAPFAFTASRLWDEGKNIATLDRAAALSRLPIHAAGPLAGPHGVAAEPRHLVLLGQLDEGSVRERLAGASLYVSAARYEPFGLSVLEAAQARLPLVLADIPTFRELWDGAARFVAPDDAQGFADCIDAIAADQVAAARLAATAAERAHRYTRRTMVSAYADLYRQLAAHLARAQGGGN